MTHSNDPSEDLKNIKVKSYRGLEERLRAYISHVDNINREFENNRKFFLEINLAIFTVFGVIYSVLLTSLNRSETIYIQYGILSYFVISLINLIYNSLGHRTLKNISFENNSDWRTKWFYRGHVPKNVNDLDSSELEKHYTTFEGTFKLDTLKQDLIEEDIRDLYLLYCYQSNYYKMAIWIRKLTLFGICVLISFFIGQILSFLGSFIVWIGIGLLLVISFFSIFVRKP